ncbi:heparan-alpha-glucosaminide N-acetyltransferase domain-containing protein [Collinsella sp. AF08-23]
MATKGRTYPNWMHREHIPILAWMGRHSLIIYATHQILLLMVFETVFQ